MKFKKSRRRTSVKISVTVMFVLFAVMGVGYAALNSKLSVTGTTIIESNSWDVHFGEYEEINNTFEKNEEVFISDNQSLIKIKVDLETISDSYQVNIPIINDGEMNAVLNTFELTPLTEEQEKYLEFYATYSDGSEIKIDDVLSKGEEQVMTFTVKYKDGVKLEDISNETEYLNLKASINYGQEIKKSRKK